MLLSKIKSLFKGKQKPQPTEKVEPELILALVTDPKPAAKDDKAVVPIKAEFIPVQKVCSLKYFTGDIDVRQKDNPGSMKIKITRKEHRLLFIDEGTDNPSQLGKAYIDEGRNFCIDGWQFETDVMLREPANKVTDEMRTKVAYILNSHYDIPANTRQIIFKKSAIYDWDVYVLSRVKTTMSDGSNDQYFYSLEKFAKMAADEINSKISLG